jgi:hypothetical protein
MDDVAHHDGSPVGPDERFFAAPPAALGALQSRASSLRGPLPEGLAGLVSRWLAALQHTNSYVGVEGISRHTLRGGVVADEVVLFAEVGELRVTRDPRPTSWTRGTGAVRHAFCDARGAERFVIDAPADPEGPGVVATFGDAAERAYSEHVVARFDAELRARGRIRFVLGPREVIEIGAGFLELEASGRRARLDASEIRSVRITRGLLELRSGEAGSAAVGIFRVRLADTHQVHALAVVMQQLLGVAMS